MKNEILLFLLNFLLFSKFQLGMSKKYNYTDTTTASYKHNRTSKTSTTAAPAPLHLPGGIFKPEMPESWKNRFRLPFTPAWMDYCDPYHCNDYHKRACGLNRKTMRFKWFQSACHLILSNKCASYRGSLKYDIIDPKYCTMYVMYLRASCPTTCEMESMDPICGISSIDNHAVLFKNECSLKAANCKEPIYQEYEEVNMNVCENYLIRSFVK